MPKTSKIQGASDANGEVAPPARYVASYAPEFDGPVTVRDDLRVRGSVGFFATAPGTQQAHITDASEAHALNAVFSDTEVEAALDALGGKINAVIAVLEAYGFTATS